MNISAEQRTRIERENIGKRHIYCRGPLQGFFNDGYPRFKCVYCGNIYKGATLSTPDEFKMNFRIYLLYEKGKVMFNGNPPDYEWSIR